MHWRRNKFSSWWHAHVRIGVGHDCVSARIDNFPVHARVMASFLLENFECTSVGEVSIAAAGNWRRQHRPAVLMEVSSLRIYIDLDCSSRILRSYSDDR